MDELTQRWQAARDALLQPVRVRIQSMDPRNPPVLEPALPPEQMIGIADLAWPISHYDKNYPMPARSYYAGTDQDLVQIGIKDLLGGSK